jgi:carbamoylphosphate synthase large subunit
MSKKNPMLKILVTGVGGPAGQGLSAMLVERGCDLLGTDSRQLEDLNFSFHQVPIARDAGFIAAIRAIARAHPVDWIIPTVSEELPVFSAHPDAFGPRVLIGSWDAVACANDKYLTAVALRLAGVAIPRFALPSEVKSAGDVAMAIGWPCISKPRVGRGGREVFIHDVEDFPAVHALSDAYILQEFAGGTDYAPELFVHPDGERPVVIVLEKTEMKEGRVGNAIAVRRVDAPDVARAALEATRGVGLAGPMDIDIRRRFDGLPVVLEINARFGANIRNAPEILEASLAYMRKNMPGG